MTDLTRGRSHNVLRYTGNPLDTLFAPRSIAVIGASEREGSNGRTVMLNLIESPYKGKIYAVNPQFLTVLGVDCHAHIGDIFEPIDLAVIATPAETVPAIIRECAEAEVLACVVLSAGFKEAGSRGAALELEVLEEAQRGQVRLVGPNSVGIMNPYIGLNAALVPRLSLKGTVGFASQSGALFSAVLDWSIRENVGFSSFVSTGSMADVGWADLIYYFGDDPNTKSILIFMESIGDARSLISAAREVALTKPIIVMKPGRTAEAAQTAKVHTGADPGDDAAINAAFRRSGVLRVDTIAELFDLAEVLAKQPRPLGPRLTIVTNAGGPAVSATDALMLVGGQLAPLPAELVSELDQALGGKWSGRNPVDLYSDADAARYRKAISLLAKDKHSDGLLAILSPQARTQAEETARALVTIYDRPAGYPYGKPVLASWMGGDDVAEGTAVLNQANIPTYDFPDDAARLFTYMWRYQKRLRSLYETPHLPTGADEASLKRFFTGELIDEVRGSGRTQLTDYESKQILQAYGIPTLEVYLVQSADEAVARAGDLGYPVFLKAYTTEPDRLPPDLPPPKPLQNVEQVLHAYAAIESAVTSSEAPQGEAAHFEGVLVQQILDLEDGFALRLVSYPDPQMGPILQFGLGGAVGELVTDTDLGLPPLNSTLARRMMEHTSVYQAMLASGVIDMKALEDLLVRFSQLVVQQQWIKNITVNPLLILPDRRITLKAHIELYDLQTTESMLPRLAIRPYPVQYVEVYVGRDGVEFVIRPIRPEDEPMMVEFHALLSEESIYYRYFRAFDLSQRVEHERLTRLCFIDYDRTIALVVVWRNPHSGEKEIVGVGRLTRMPDPSEAEFAIIVRDDFQGKGLGTVLLRRLLQFGRDEGIERIIAFMLPGNTGMINVSKKLGFRFEREDDLLKAIIDLKAES
jgi:acetyltransferase